MKTHSAAVTLSQLADLVATDHSALCRNPRLPQATPVHTGAAHRPEHAIELAALAQFALDQTAHLTEAEVRLRLALAGRTEPRRSKSGKIGPFYLVPNDDGTFAMRRSLRPEDLTFEEQRDLRAAIGEQP
ncbi:hypothetical protein [Pseudomonas plecoglossicida]|uniref:hypothetical protein n=1 Tax=Pseudomonas plecoglossicida TaxID=70775 RepID=UPI00051CF5FA|nr:hypothetical protein [Pseudomonas plecoglossicida]KGK24281.1 hypothetical protein GT93_05240 [Pseudomonas plecoglossicida]